MFNIYSSFAHQNILILDKAADGWIAACLSSEVLTTHQEEEKDT